MGAEMGNASGLIYMLTSALRARYPLESGLEGVSGHRLSEWKRHFPDLTHYSRSMISQTLSRKRRFSRGFVPWRKYMGTLLAQSSGSAIRCLMNVSIMAGRSRERSGSQFSTDGAIIRSRSASSAATACVGVSFSDPSNKANPSWDAEAGGLAREGGV